MRIVYVIDHMSGFGGAQRVISNLINESIARSSEVMLALTGGTSESVYPIDPKVFIYRYNNETKGIAGKIEKIGALRKAIIDFSPDVVVSFLTMVNIETIIATFGARIPVIISERNDPARSSRNEKVLSKLFYKFAKCIVVQTGEIERKIRTIYDGPIYTIANPITTHTHEKLVYEQTKNIIAVGRLNPQKNYPLMIEGFSEFHKDHAGYTLNIFGAGDQEQRLKELVADLMLGDCVVFHGNVSNIMEIEKDYDFFVMTSDYEGMPNALAEAMSVGLPCIATDCDGGGSAALIKNGTNGLLIPKGNKEKLIEAMCCYSDNSDIASRMGKKAKEIKNDLSIGKIMQTWFDVIEKMSIR